MEQGKRKDQINFSSRMWFIGFIGLTLCFIWAISFLPDPQPPTEGMPHNYYHPKVWGDDVEIPEEMLDIDMDCGDDNSIPKYGKFTDIPAGAVDTIMVEEVLYTISDNNNKWVPIYEDEDVMWIGGNHDTIWE